MMVSQIERELQRQKLEDQTWEDQIDVCGPLTLLSVVINGPQNAYQQMPLPYPSRLFKHIPSSEARLSPPAPAEGRRTIQTRAVRMRYGRGGRILLDRRNTLTRGQQAALLDSPSDADTDPEYKRKLAERWKFDADDQPSNGPENDEQDRILVDDYESRYGSTFCHGCRLY
jgi:enhancer of polycomb-like protein